MVTRPPCVDILTEEKRGWGAVSADWQTHRGKPVAKDQESAYQNATL